MRLFVVAMIFFIACTVFAQDENWKPGEGGFEFNCTVLEQVQATISDPEAKIIDVAELPFVRVNDTTLSVERYFALILLAQFQQNSKVSLNMETILGTAISACSDPTTTDSDSSTEGNDSFNVTATGNANLRSCAGTNCDVAGQVAKGQTLKVVKVDGDWYEVEYEGDTAFIASFLTVRAPDNLISTDESYQDKRTGCVVAFDIKRGSSDMNLILAGDRRNDVVADLYRPNESTALKVQAQLDKTFSDTGEPYILQYYRFNIGWPIGVYALEFTLDGQTSKVAWDVPESAAYNIYLICN